jgi:hypothetical protein
MTISARRRRLAGLTVFDHRYSSLFAIEVESKWQLLAHSRSERSSAVGPLRTKPRGLIRP